MKLDKNGFATDKGTITIYHTDADGVYTHSTLANIEKGTGLPARAYADEPPAAQDGFAIVRDGSGWTQVADLRGTTVYSTADGSEQTISELGDLPDDVTKKPRPSEYHSWNGSKWTLTADAKRQQLSDAKANKLAQLNTAAEKTIEQAAQISKTPAFERATWDIQRQESEAWHADNSVATPNLDRIAQMRGVPADILRQKAYQKAMQYQTLTTVVAGQRQRYEDMIDAASTLKDLESIEIKFNLGS